MRGGLIVSALAAVAACSFDSGLHGTDADGQLDAASTGDAGQGAAPVDASALADAQPGSLQACMTSSLYAPNPATGRRYRAVDLVVDWPTARAGCEQDDGHLIVIDDQAENDYAFSLLGENQWLGLTDEAVEGQFEWVTGAPLTYTNWLSNQPDDLPFFDEDYVEIWITGRWNDLPAGDINNRYVCECDPAWSPGI